MCVYADAVQTFLALSGNWKKMTKPSLFCHRFSDFQKAVLYFEGFYHLETVLANPFPLVDNIDHLGFKMEY